MSDARAVPLPALVLYLLALSLQRLLELRRSARNTRILRARGAVEHGAAHYPFIVALHVLFPLALIAEVARGGARPPPAWPLWLTLIALAQVLRLWTQRTLGDLWTTRVLVLPGQRPIERGLYRFTLHPGYIAVIVELFAAPMMFGAWRSASVVSALNALLLWRRVLAEERALEIGSAR